MHHSLWLELVPFVCNLDIMIFADAPMEIQVAIHCGFIVPGDLDMCFRALAFSEADLSSLFSN